MKQVKRQNAIMNMLQLEKSCGVIELATKLGVSDETIRRDIKDMAKSGSVEKIHGGVMLPQASLEPPFLRRLEVQRREKQRIAKLAASIIQDGETILIDNGSTSCYVAKALHAHRNLTVVTNSTEVARDLCARNNNTVFMAGGEIRADDSAAYGSTAINFARQFTTERAILSIASISAEQGYLDCDLGEAEFKRAIIPQAASIIMVADHMKFNRPGVVKICDFEAVDLLLTDQLPPQSIIDKMGRDRILIA
ncbi:DeoR/GlpR family DNA-binding transcription regulator [Sneathiella sp.]|uniref:DeoR/GlpR family DNA-binding transcription regulator n=1 Tax=Sneathiella sp. TaxID=1964365 RepID=UPI003566B119